MEMISVRDQTGVEDFNNASNGSKQSTVTDTSFGAKSHKERAALLGALYVEPNETRTAPLSGEDWISTEESGSIAVTPAPTASVRATTITRSASTEYVQIIRTHYMKLILQSLEKVRPHAGTPSASVHINKILRTIRDLEEKSPNDPVLEILFALYDALAYEELWATYATGQYEEAVQIFLQIVDEPVNSKNIEKAIMALDDAGFETIPYQFSLEDDDDIL